MRAIKKSKKYIRKLISKVKDRVNRLYLSISFIIIVGLIMLLLSFKVYNSEVQNVLIGLGTGIITSSLVALYIEVINNKLAKKRLQKFRMILFNPILNVVKTVYVDSAIRINEYIIKTTESYNTIKLNEYTKEFKNFIIELRKKNIEEQNEEEKRDLLELLKLPMIYYRELINLYKQIPYESLIIDNIISKEEYDSLKVFSIVEVCQNQINKIDVNNIEKQENYIMKVELLGNIILLINKILKIFDFMQKYIELENTGIKDHLDEIYFYEVYSKSEEYIEQQIKNYESQMEYYEMHPEELPNEEDNELHREINEAIWQYDTEKIIELFPHINGDDVDVQNLLTWKLAKDVMKDKKLRKMYFDKFGVKYKVRKGI